MREKAKRAVERKSLLIFKVRREGSGNIVPYQR